MQLEDSVALVTGARRGLGAEFVRQLRERGARKVYAAVRDDRPEPVEGAEVVRMDVTDPTAIARVAAELTDVSLLVNNAGISARGGLVAGDMDDIRRTFDTNFWGLLEAVRAFAPSLAGNGGGAILNVLSALSWYAYERAGAYSAAKAAAWSLSDTLRLELAADHTLVTAVFVGAVDTEMMADYTGPKLDPGDVVRAALDAVAAGRFEAIVDDSARQAKESLVLDPGQRYPQLGTTP